MDKNRKYIVLTILVAMVAVAGYLNWNYNNEFGGPALETGTENLGEATMVNAGVDSSKGKGDVLKEARETKNLSRSKAIEMLNTIINDDATDSENKKQASSELIEMSANMEAEGVIEGVLKTKGYENSVVFITNGIATVAVKTDKNLSASDVAKIQDAVKNNAKVSGEKITITQLK